MTLKFYVQWEEVRHFCINYDLYTRGDNDAYMHMLLEMCDKGASTLEEVEAIAEDIIIHSNKDTLDDNSFDPKGWIMQEILNGCTFITVE